MWLDFPFVYILDILRWKTDYARYTKSDSSIEYIEIVKSKPLHVVKPLDNPVKDAKTLQISTKKNHTPKENIHHLGTAGGKSWSVMADTLCVVPVKKDLLARDVKEVKKAPLLWIAKRKPPSKPTSKVKKSSTASKLHTKCIKNELKEDNCVTKEREVTK